MKALLINGSPRANGNTTIALKELEKTLLEEGMEVEWINLGTKAVRGCIACNKCHETGKGCVFGDIVNESYEKCASADAIVVASPVYYGMANGTMTSFLQRLFYSATFSTDHKVGAAIAVCRRGGASATFDQLNKFFSICGMTVAGSQYWNSVHGRLPGEAEQDLEGLQTMRTLGHHIAYLVRAVKAEKEKNGLPEREKRISTHFIR